MNNSRSKLLVDMANSRKNVLCISESHDLINYIDKANEGKSLINIISTR